MEWAAEMTGGVATCDVVAGIILGGGVETVNKTDIDPEAADEITIDIVVGDEISMDVADGDEKL